ncbi:hypothetical protein MRX96_054411 [Rhipicephalus microplus]
MKRLGGANTARVTNSTTTRSRGWQEHKHTSAGPDKTPLAAPRPSAERQRVAARPLTTSFPLPPSAAAACCAGGRRGAPLTQLPLPRSPFYGSRGESRSSEKGKHGERRKEELPSASQWQHPLSPLPPPASSPPSHTVAPLDALVVRKRRRLQAHGSCANLTSLVAVFVSVGRQEAARGGQVFSKELAAHAAPTRWLPSLGARSLSLHSLASSVPIERGAQGFKGAT